MLTITIIFALLVAVWGFPGAIRSAIASGLAHAEARRQRESTRPSTSRPRASGPAISA